MSPEVSVAGVLAPSGLGPVASVTKADELARIELTVNGVDVVMDVEPRRSLADVLRRELRLGGTQLGCDQGACGSCTVLVDSNPVRSCLMLGVETDGTEVRTVESLVPDDAPLSELQYAFSVHHALQCGFCTAGFLMIATALIEKGEPLDRSAVRTAVAANLCRCTGYTPIIDAILAFATSRGLVTEHGA